MPAFDDDFAAADAMFAEAFGGEVTYVYGSSEITVTAEASLHDYEVQDPHGVFETIQSRDYVISAAALVIDGEPITPRAGNKIKETINGSIEIFQVMPLGRTNRFGDRPAAEHTDTSETSWLIHTKHIGAE
ncbi:MAG TPA: hypothetical protein ENH78_02175 [Phycisphaerae bacterium]|nr:hypothetical protein [Phycisphaerae bacterium]